MRHHMCTRLGRRDVEQRSQLQNETSRKEGGRCGAREGEPMGYQEGGLWQPDAKAMEVVFTQLSTPTVERSRRDLVAICDFSGYFLLGSFILMIFAISDRLFGVVVHF